MQGDMYTKHMLVAVCERIPPIVAEDLRASMAEVSHTEYVLWVEKPYFLKTNAETIYMLAAVYQVNAVLHCDSPRAEVS